MAVGTATSPVAPEALPCDTLWQLGTGEEQCEGPREACDELRSIDCISRAASEARDGIGGGTPPITDSDSDGSDGAGDGDGTHPPTGGACSGGTAAPSAVAASPSGDPPSAACCC